MRAAVVEAALEREDIGDVGRRDEALPRDLLEARRPQLDPVQHGGREPRDRDRLVERPRNRAVQKVEVIRTSGAGVQGRECSCQVAGSLAGLGSDRGEGVRVLLLRHQRARPAVRIAELDEPELLARVDLEVLAELALVRGRDREGREQLDVDVGLPRRVLRMLDDPVAAEQLGEPRSVERPARACAATGAGDARPERRVRRAHAIGVPERRIGVRQEQVPDGGGLGRLQVGVVRRERVSGRAGVSCERGGLVGEGVVQLPRSSTRSQTEPDAKGLAAWTARAQPSRRRIAHPPLELGLARIEGVAERRIPRELVAGDRVQLEQASHECARVVAGQVAALDQGDCVREIRERQAAGEPRAMLRSRRRRRRPRARLRHRPATARLGRAPPSPS